MRNLINAQLWRITGLCLPSCSTDFYYTKVAQKFYDYLWFTPFGKDGGEYLCMRMALSLARYLEDVISDFGLWHAFTSKHKELYGKYLPFYDIDEENYYTDEINLEDVRFILWMEKQKDSEDIFFNPENPYLCQTADVLYAEMEELFEKAPINDEMIPKVMKAIDMDDFYMIKLAFTSLISTYLLSPSIPQKRRDVEDSLSNFKGEFGDSMYSYAVDAMLMLNKKLGPLNLYAKDWLAALLAHWGEEERSKQVAAIEARAYDLYHVTSYDKETIFLETATGDELTLPRNSFSDLAESTLETKAFLMASLVNYQGVWLVNGVSSWLDKPKLFQKRKEQYERFNNSVDLNRQFLEANDGHRMLYFKDAKEAQEWIGQHIGIAPDNQGTLDPDGQMRYIAIYIPVKGDLQVMNEGAWFIKDERNPYYEQSKGEDEGHNYLVSSDMIQDEALHYLIEHHLLPDACMNSIHGVQRGKQLVQENIDFIARFMRVSNY